ncbi:hypothetical protein J2W91_000681 [Paenibacillus amylolyticus]|uniref:Uncharacterized protein n=1 Tax=Paenibacillus amylolyticus TaxID=1451 RepID=A0AAP5GZZ3_PAEAM|nr:hypothetical protein [Paenibacillus amylolyticus]MDR6722233.1 hypothetical protein [Paenibacillus amylolyticus]
MDTTTQGRSPKMKPYALARTSLMLALSILLLVGCSSSSTSQEVKIYSGQATNEGNIRAQSQGHGLNGVFIQELDRAFNEKGIKLMNNMSADDGEGGITYMYLLNGSGRHVVKVHIFGDDHTRTLRMKEMYGNAEDQAVLQNVLGKTSIRSKGYVSMVYTASGGQKDVYEDEVLQVFDHMLYKLD